MECVKSADSWAESAAQLVVGRKQILGQNAGLANHRDEIGVTRPPRQHVKVQMVGHAGAGAAAQVHPQVVALGMINGFQRRLELLG